MHLYKTTSTTKSLGGRMHPKDALKFIKSPLMDGYIPRDNLKIYTSS